MNCLDCGGSECVCALRRMNKQLAEACQIFTRGLGNAEGYYPTIGAPATARAIALMKQAEVTPLFYLDPPRDGESEHLSHRWLRPTKGRPE